MLRCALDVQHGSVRAALFGFWPNEPPARLECRLIPWRSSARVLEVLRGWEHWYQLDQPGQERAVVGCIADRWPRGLQRRLEDAGFTIVWIEDASGLSQGLSFLQSLQMNRLFMRATLMAHWPEGCPTGQQTEAVVLDLQHRVLRSRLVELEYDLYAAGRSLCPAHLSESCPDCEFLSAPDLAFGPQELEQ